MEQPKALKSIAFSHEPAMWLAAIQALIGLIVGFGVPLTSEQVGLIMAFCAAIGGLIVRQKVFAPTSKEGDKLEAVKYENQPIQSVMSAEEATK